MNQFFSFNRFSLFGGKHWADNKKRYLLSIIAFIILLIAWFVFTMLVESSLPMQQELRILTFFFTLFVLGSFYASQYFRDLSSRAKGINFLLVPASTFEKILCGLLFTVVCFFAVFSVAFYLVDLLMLTISNKIIVADNPAAQQDPVNVFKAAILPFGSGSYINIILIFFAIQAAFLLGSVYFSKYSFIKTVISGFVVFFIMFCLLYLLYEKFLPLGEYKNGFMTSYLISTGGEEDRLVELPGWIRQVMQFLLLFGIAPFLWVVTYYRLKEKQV